MINIKKIINALHNKPQNLGQFSIKLGREKCNFQVQKHSTKLLRWLRRTSVMTEVVVWLPPAPSGPNYPLRQAMR